MSQAGYPKRMLFKEFFCYFYGAHALKALLAGSGGRPKLCWGDARARKLVWELAVRVLKLLYLPYISLASPLLPPLTISPQVRVLKLHWDPISRPYLAHISPTSRPYLAGARAQAALGPDHPDERPLRTGHHQDLPNPTPKP